MKNKSPILFGILGLAVLAGLSFAATTSTTPPPAPPGPADEMHARIAGKLGLSAEQQKAIAELRARQRAEVLALLTPEQQQKAGEMRGQVKQHFDRFARGQRPGHRGERRGPAMQPPQGDPLAAVAMGERIKDRIAEKLQLSDGQRDQLEHLGREYRAQQRELAKKHHEAMRGVLTPEQQEKAKQWKQHRQHGPGAQRGPHGQLPPLVSMADGFVDPMADVSELN